MRVNKIQFNILKSMIKNNLFLVSEEGYDECILEEIFFDEIIKNINNSFLIEHSIIPYKGSCFLAIQKNFPKGHIYITCGILENIKEAVIFITPIISQSFYSKILFHRGKDMLKKEKIKFLQEGEYIARIPVNVFIDDTDWSPYLPPHEIYKLDQVRKALKEKNFEIVSKFGELYKLVPLKF